MYIYCHPETYCFIVSFSVARHIGCLKLGSIYIYIYIYTCVCSLTVIIVGNKQGEMNLKGMNTSIIFPLCYV